MESVTTHEKQSLEEKRNLPKKQYQISAFFPMYNDSGTVELMYKRLTKVLSEHCDDYEIIMVNDCSPDNSGEIANNIALQDKRVRVIHHETNKGYGGALRSGFAAATKHLVFYTDGDAQYDVSELSLLIPFIEDYDIVNGFKIKRHDPFYRTILGKMYNFGMHIMFGLKVKDVDCDFRLMHTNIFRNITLESNTGLICTEMMRKIQDGGYTIKNVPVNHFDRQYGKSQFFRPKRIFKTLFGLINQWYELVLMKRLKKWLRW